MTRGRRFRSPRLRCEGQSSAGLLVVLTLMLSSAVFGLAGGSASAEPSAAGSAVTVSGSGEFADLKITVSQTTDLINQTVRVSWTGAKPTEPAIGRIERHFLQIMQCWGDDDTGPRREQCQFGALLFQPVKELALGSFVVARQVSYGTSLVDDEETYRQQPGSFDPAYVPFLSVTGKEVSGNFNEFYDAQSTNEIPIARTRLGGTGEEFFEIQTDTEAPGLGCGEPVVDGTATVGRSCWLVIVPRGDTEVDGSKAAPNSPRQQLDSSPLSASNWANRIEVPLQFRPIGQACPIGEAERRMLGHEFLSEAVGRWQPALCADGGTVYGYSQVSDDTARRQLTQTSSPGMVFVTHPVPPASVPPDRRIVYAPVALSGLSIAFLVERTAGPIAPEEVKLLDGQRFTELKLTPRLVAKLLTQSYWGAVPGGFEADYLKSNPSNLLVDPEFIELNPDFENYREFLSIPDMLVPLGNLDGIEPLWSWINADKEARDFLDGNADRWGMKVNSNYQGMSLPIPNFPKSDLRCDKPETDPIRICALDGYPYANDMHEAGRAVSRGDSLARTPAPAPDETGKHPLKKVDRQTPGRRGLLAIVDVAAAARYELPTAQLRNVSGEFVAPATPSLLAGLAEMQPSAVEGVLEPNPLTTAKDAYPLATVTYAATPPALLDTVAGKDYADFLRYAVGPGQEPGIEPGQLPFGYAPLPQPLRDQTNATAATIADQAGKPVSTPTTQSDDSSEASSSENGPSLGGAANEITGPAGNAGNTAAPDAASSADNNAIGTPPMGTAPTSDDAASGATTSPIAKILRTPAQLVGMVRYALLAIFVVGGLAACAAPVLYRLSAAREEVMPPTGL
ncbi:MAG: hypothetical protein ACT4NY_22610 [Pseudonocardiales bacterium]